MPTRQQIRERVAKSLGLFVTLGSPTDNINTGGLFTKIADLAVDNERFRWSHLYNRTDDESRLITSTVASTGQIVVQRAFTNTLGPKSCDLYGLFSPGEWNDLLNDQVLPDLYYLDRFTITLTAGTAEYNATNTATWLKDVGQIVRFRYRNTQSALKPIESEAAVVYPQQATDGVVTLHIPGANFPTDYNLVVEARHYYTALAADANSIGGPEKLVEACLRHEALKQLFVALGPAAKRIYGQAMVLAERDRAEQEHKWLPKTAFRDWWSEDEPQVGEPGTEVIWGW